MAWLSIVMLVVEIIKLIMKLRDGDEREGLFTELGRSVEAAHSFGDKAVLKALRDRVKERCKECSV
jgi:hypothetical protein